MGVYVRGKCPDPAKDTHVYGSPCPATVDALSLTVTECIADDVASWMESNELRLNASKTEVTWCTSSRRQHQRPTVATLPIDGVPVAPASFVRDLGIRDGHRNRIHRIKFGFCSIPISSSVQCSRRLSLG